MRYCSAALIYTEDYRIVLVSNKSQNKWVIPKGGIDPRLTPLQNAAKECMEEGGFECAKTGFSLGHYEVLKEGVINRVEVFALAATVTAADERRYATSVSPEGRLVRVFSPEKAVNEVDPYLAVFIHKLRCHFEACAAHDSRKGM